MCFHVDGQDAVVRISAHSAPSTSLKYPPFTGKAAPSFGGGPGNQKHQVAALEKVETVAIEHRHFDKTCPRQIMLQSLLGDGKKIKIFEKCDVDNKKQMQNLGASCGGRGVSLGGRMRSQPELPSFHREGCS